MRSPASHFQFVLTVGQRLEEAYFRELVTLAGKARLLGGELIETVGDDAKIGLGCRGVKAYDDVAASNMGTVTHKQLADNAAGQMLYLLVIAVDND